MGKIESGNEQHTQMAGFLLQLQNITGQPLPNVEFSSGEVRRIGRDPIRGNSAFDIWEGLYLERDKCAIKAMRGLNVTPDTRRVCTS